MKYIDSNVFIYPAIASPDTELKASKSKKILLKIAEGKISAATASLTWDELVWAIRKTLGEQISKIEGKRFLEFPNLKILDVDEIILRKAQKILTENNLKPRDAIHAACMIKNKLKEIISDDDDFDKVPHIRRIDLTKI